MNTVDFDDFDEVSYNNDTKSSKNKRAYIRMHQTKGGNTVPLLAMEDTHLVSTIKLFLKIAIEAKKSALYNVNDTFDMFHNELNGFKPMTKSEAIGRISSIMYNMEPYFTELFIRGNFSALQEFQPIVAELLGRKNTIFLQKPEEESNELISND